MYQSKDVWKVKLYPVRGNEQDGLRPCLIISPNSMNSQLATLIVAPLTTSLKNWPTRINLAINDLKGQVCLEHIRSVSKERFVDKVGSLSTIEYSMVLKHLRSMFEE